MKPRKIEITVYREKACTDIYMNQYSFAYKSWKQLQRAHANCSTEKYLKSDLKHVRKTFHEVNNYSHQVITKVFKKFKEMAQSRVEKQVEGPKNTSIKNHMLVLPYK